MEEQRDVKVEICDAILDYVSWHEMKIFTNHSVIKNSIMSLVPTQVLEEVPHYM